MRQVRAFVSVAHLKSFTRAATLLHISQPALTVQIRKLEEILGVRLLDRNSRTVDITRVGRELVPIFQRILHELDSVVVDTRALATQQHGVRTNSGATFLRRRSPSRNNLPVSEGKPQNDVCRERCNCEQGQCECPI